MEKKKFYLCKHCGNLFGVICDGRATPVCCGDPMDALVPNTSDGAGEKHLPSLTRNGKRLAVQVGAVAHPMLEEHYIAWIVVSQGNRTQRIALKPSQEPKAEFALDSESEPVTVYAYCNIHGLWSAEG